MFEQETDNRFDVKSVQPIESNQYNKSTEIFEQSDTYIIEDKSPGNGNNCQGHKRSIEFGGKGHKIGDDCGCDDIIIVQPVPIDIITPILMCTSIFLIFLTTKIKTIKNGRFN